jgi:SAM-dependent methyltransferase
MGIYKKDFASIYDKSHSNEFYNGYVIFLKKIIKEREIKNPLVLDIACGTGRLIKKLRVNNIKAEGLDISADMLHIAKKNNPEAKFYIQDFIHFSTGKKYDIIICTFDSINYISNKKVLARFFNNINNYLNEGGIFVFDFNTIYKKVKKKVISKNVIYISRIKNRKWFVIVRTKKGGNLKKENHIERLYSLEEIKSALSKSDFKIIGLYADFKNKIKKAGKNQRLIVVLKK